MQSKKDGAESARAVSSQDKSLLLRHGLRLIDAEWLFGHVISIGGIGASAASHADVAELAAAALAFQLVDVAQVGKDRRVVPDVGKRLLAQVAGHCGQITARIYLTLERDEADAGPGQAALGH